MVGNWIQLAVGVWVLLSPWIVGGSSLPFLKWSNVASGTIITLLSLWSLFPPDTKKKEHAPPQ